MIALCLVLIGLIPRMQGHLGTQWDNKVPVTASSLLAHIFLVHDLSHNWLDRIDGPLWSVAVERQIYFLMPLVLLPLWRRVNKPTIVALCLLAAAPALKSGRFEFIHPWFLGLFAAGMLAADIVVRRAVTTRLVGQAAALIAFIALVALVVKRDYMLDRSWASETVVGLAMAATICWLALRSIDGAPVGVTRFLEWRPVALLGLISYSLYLLHSPLLGAANLLTINWHMTVLERYLFLLFVALPIAICICSAFYWIVERNFKNTHQKSMVAAIPAETTERAPLAAAS